MSKDAYDNAYEKIKETFEKTGDEELKAWLISCGFEFEETPDEERITLKEFAELSSVSYEKAVSYVCDCDLVNGYLCDFHRNPNIKLPNHSWVRKACDCELGFTCEYHQNIGISRNLKKPDFE